MNDVETRLRDALSARATAVTQDSGAYAAVVARRERRGRHRLAAVAAAATGVAAVAAIVVAVRPAEQPPPVATRPAPVTAAPAPTVWIGVAGLDAVLWRDDFDGSQSVRLDGTAVTAVAAFGDSKRFVLAGQRDGRCRSILTRWDVTDDTPDYHRTISHAVRGREVPGEVKAMAVSPDGKRLAYTMKPAIADGTRCGDDIELRVRELGSGAEQVWRPAAGDLDSPLDVPSLSWSPDGRHLAAGAMVAVVDTTTPERTLRVAPTQPTVFLGDQHCLLQDRAYRGRTGEMVGYLFCPGSRLSGVHVLDGNTPVRQLIEAPGPSYYTLGEVEFDDSGDHAFLRIGHGHDHGLYRWDADRGLHQVATGDDEVDGIDW